MFGYELFPVVSAQGKSFFAISAALSPCLGSFFRFGCGARGISDVISLQIQGLKKVENKTGIIPFQVFAPERCVVWPIGAFDVMDRSERAFSAYYHTRSFHLSIGVKTVRAGGRNNGNVTWFLFVFCYVEATLEEYKIS